jgi:hypothetical protein
MPTLAHTQLLGGYSVPDSPEERLNLASAFVGIEQLEWASPPNTLVGRRSQLADSVGSQKFHRRPREHERPE